VISVRENLSHVIALIRLNILITDKYSLTSRPENEIIKEISSTVFYYQLFTS